jgi:hypothetical protein
MFGLRGDRLTFLLFVAGAAVSVALAAFTLSGWRAGVLWAVALTCVLVAGIYAAKAQREGQMAVKNNTFDQRVLG